MRAAAGLPDPEALEPGKELKFPQGPIGISIGNLYPFTEKESYPPWKALPKGWTSTWDALMLARNQIIALFHGGAGPDVAGPVGIAQATGQVVEESGWQTLLDFAALLSINLAIINILPLPMLDGGRIAFVLLEVVRGGQAHRSREGGDRSPGGPCADHHHGRSRHVLRCHPHHRRRLTLRVAVT